MHFISFEIKKSYYANVLEYFFGHLHIIPCCTVLPQPLLAQPAPSFFRSLFFLPPSQAVANLIQSLIMVKISESVDEEHNLFFLTVAVN